MEGIKFEELDLLAEGERGQVFECENHNSANRLTLITRKANTVSGAHLHAGLHPNKAPETGVLLSGTAEFYFRDSHGHEFRKTFDRPVRYKIANNIYHEVRAITDIIFLEFGAASDGQGDTFAEFPG